MKMSNKKLKLLKYLFTTLAYIGLFSPITIVLIKNFDVYFTENKSAFSVGMGGVLAILSIVLLAKYGFKRLNKVFWSTILWVMVICLETILKDAVVIVTAVDIGVVAFVVFEIPMNYFKKRCEIRNNEVDRIIASNEFSKFLEEKNNSLKEQNKKERVRC